MNRRIKTQLIALAVMGSFALGSASQHIISSPAALSREEIIALPGTPLMWGDGQEFIIVGTGNLTADVYTLTKRGYVLSAQTQRFSFSKIVIDSFKASMGVMVGYKDI